MEKMVLVWLLIFVQAVVIEVITLGLTSIWFAGGALVCILAAVLHVPVNIQIILFVVVSMLLLFFTRPIAVKYFNKDRVLLNVEGLAGRQAIVTEDIDNMQSIGHAMVNGQEWTARSLEDEVTIAQGSVVDIVSIHGVKLIVKPTEYLSNIQKEEQ